MMGFLVFHIRSVGLALVAAGLFLGLVRFTTLPYVGVSAIAFVIVLGLFAQRYLRIKDSLWDLGLIVAAYVATVFLMVLTEWRFVTMLLGTLGALTIGTLFDILLSNNDAVPVYVKKAFRRIRVMAWVFVAASIMIMAYALSFFFQKLPSGCSSSLLACVWQFVRMLSGGCIIRCHLGVLQYGCLLLRSLLCSVFGSFICSHLDISCWDSLRPGCGIWPFSLSDFI